MLLFLRGDLVKSGPPKGQPKGMAGDGDSVDERADQGGVGRGEYRSGTYRFREQDGYDEDGSPKYRYFKTEEEHEAFLERRGENKNAQRLKDRVAKEHKESSERVASKDKDDDDKKKPNLLEAKKSLPIFVRI